jgi:hypothetical protein
MEPLNPIALGLAESLSPANGSGVPSLPLESLQFGSLVPSVRQREGSLLHNSFSNASTSSGASGSTTLQTTYLNLLQLQQPLDGQQHQGQIQQHQPLHTLPLQGQLQQEQRNHLLNWEQSLHQLQQLQQQNYSLHDPHQAILTQLLSNIPQQLLDWISSTNANKAESGEAERFPSSASISSQHHVPSKQQPQRPTEQQFTDGVSAISPTINPSQIQQLAHFQPALLARIQPNILKSIQESIATTQAPSPQQIQQVPPQHQIYSPHPTRFPQQLELQSAPHSTPQNSQRNEMAPHLPSTVAPGSVGHGQQPDTAQILSWLVQCIQALQPTNNGSTNNDTNENLKYDSHRDLNNSEKK